MRFDADVKLLIGAIQRACDDVLALAHPDVFLSYSREDLERARDIATALETEGWSVFWDRRLPPGRSYKDYLEEKLDSCRVVIVLWSPHSVESHWVKTEAAHGHDRTPPALLPIMISETKIPLSFSILACLGLFRMEARRTRDAFNRLLAAIHGWCREMRLRAPNTVSGDD